MCSDDGQGMTLCCSIGVTRSSPELHALRDNPSDAEDKKTPSFSARGFGVQRCRSVAHAARAVDAHDAYALADPENLVFLNLLHVSTHAAVIFTYGDFNTLRAGQALFGR